MANSEAMTSSTRSFAYSYRLVKKCFVKICETSKCHNFLIFQPIFIRFSLFCSENFTLSSEIMLNLFRSSPLNPYFGHCDHWQLQKQTNKQWEIFPILRPKYTPFPENTATHAFDRGGGGGGGGRFTCEGFSNRGIK